MKRIFFFLIFLLVSNSIYAQSTEFELPISFSDGEYNIEMKIGMAAGATDSFDVLLDKPAAPAPPLDGVFDGFIQGIEDDLWWDFRAVSSDTVSYVVELIPRIDSGPVTVTWDPSGLAEIGTFLIEERSVLQDEFLLDMSTASQLVTTGPPDLSFGFVIKVIQGSSNTSTFTLPASEDTYARGSGAYANDEFYQQDSLFVINGNGPSMRAFSYLKFDLSTIADSITSAVVKLFPYDVGGAPLHEVTLTTEGWQADTLNWNNRPQVGSALGKQWTPIQDQLTSIDLTTEAYAAWVDASQSLEIRLESLSSGVDSLYAVYGSKEHVNSNYHPVIEIATSGGGGNPLNQPPSVSITMPGAGLSATEGDDIVLKATASDDDGTVANVKYYADAVLLGEGVGAEYSFTWEDVLEGSYVLTAVATDDSSATTTSDPVSVMVDPASGGITLIASEDTYARGSGAYANDEFYQQDSLFVINGNGASMRAFSYLKFDLSTIADSITSAVVKLFPYDVGGAPLHEVTLTTEGWQADTLNWNNRPQVGSALGKQWTPVQDQLTSIDLTTEAYAAWVDASQSLEIRLESLSSGVDSLYAVYGSKEHANSAYHPVIEITTSGGGNPLNQPPSVSITMPGAGLSFTEGDDIVLKATASDDDGTVANVKYYADAVLLGEGVGAEYSFTWEDVLEGSYVLTAVATDDSSATTTSDPVSVMVDPASGGITLIASEDTYARGSGAYANDEFYQQDSLFVINGNGASMRAFSYLKFDLSTIADSITSAVVKLFPYDVGGAPLHEVTLTTEGWQADTLNWNNRPQVGSALGKQWTPIQDQLTSIDLTTEAYAAWVDASQSLEIRLESLSSGVDSLYAVYGSKEHVNSTYHPVIEITTSGTSSESERTVSVGEYVEKPEKFTLEGNYPNPFNPTTTLLLNLPQDALVQVHVYDLMGRQVLAYPLYNMTAGKLQRFTINASSLASGVYLYSVTAQMQDESLTKVGRMTFLK